MSTPTLPQDLQNELDASNGIVQGASFVLMKPEVVLNWFGYTEDELRRELQPAMEQADRGELVEWNLQEFLAEMQRRKTGVCTNLKKARLLSLTFIMSQLPD